MFDSMTQALPGRMASADPLATPRLLSGIASLKSVVFIADRHQRIVAASETAEAAIQKLGYWTGSLEGADLATVHGNPDGFRAAVSDPARLPFEHKIKTPNAVYKALVSAIRDDDGSISGYSVAWEDQTKRQRVEVELGRVLSMIESCPTFIICGDPDLTMRYLNPAGRISLEKLAAVVPVSGDGINGQPLTVFFPHAPEAGRILSNPANLPWN